jgi:hypothetical protein
MSPQKGRLLFSAASNAESSPELALALGVTLGYWASEGPSRDLTKSTTACLSSEGSVVMSEYLCSSLIRSSRSNGAKSSDQL